MTLLLFICGALTVTAQNQPVASLDEGNRLFQSGDHKAAEAMYRLLIGQKTNTSERGMATFNLGILLQKLNRYDEAVATFTNLIGQPVNDLEPGAHIMEIWRNYRHRAQWEIGNCYFSQGDFARALEAYRASNTKYPLRSWCGNELHEQAFRYEWHTGLCHDHLGKTVDALKHYYKAGLTAGLGAPDANVCFRIIDIYQEAGQEAALRRLLDEIDGRYLAHIRELEKGNSDGWRFSQREIEEMKPTATVRRTLQMRSWAREGKRTELIKLLKVRNAVTGPPFDGNWEAVEAARLLALTPGQSVPDLLAASAPIPHPVNPWIVYALARCGGTNALSWIGQRIGREENGWAIQSMVYSLRLAGQDGENVLDSAPVLKPMWDQMKREPRPLPSQPPDFPKISPQLRLPAKISELE